MSWTQIKSLTISDIHFGNPANPARYVIAGLNKKLTRQYLKDIQVVYIGGDVFDRSLPVKHQDTPAIISWIRRFLSMCASLGIVVIIIEGTPSHDHLQSEIFVGINDAAEDGFKCELYYVKEVDILFIEKFGIHVLCIPDEKNTSDEVTYNQVLAMMKARAIEQVDFAIMHGFFEFQVRFGGHTRFHDSEAYMKLVRYLIWIGHDHEFQQHQRIIVQGSPDRQRHGMESPKGFIKSIVNRDGSFEAEFEVNQYAMVFKTIEVDDDVDTANKQIYAECDKLPMNGLNHIRIAANRGHPVLSAIDSFQASYPFIRFSKKVLDEEKEKEASIIAEDEVPYTPFTIDESNIKTVVQERLGIALISPEEKAYFDELMESIK